MFPPHTDPFEATLNAFRHQNLRTPVCSAWFLEESKNEIFISIYKSFKDIMAQPSSSSFSKK